MECTKPDLRLRGPLAARTAVLVGHSQTVLALRPPAATPPQVLRHSLPPVEHEACFFHVQLLKCLTSYSDCISVNGKHLVPSSVLSGFNHSVDPLQCGRGPRTFTQPTLSGPKKTICLCWPLTHRLPL